MLYFFYNFFFIYIKMSKTLWAKYYQENKDYKKKLVKDIKIFLKKKAAMFANVTISQKVKNKSLLSIEKKIKNKAKRFIIIIKKYFNLENFIRKSIKTFLLSDFANYLLKYKEFFRVSFSRNIRTAFFSENIRNFLEFPFPDAWEIFSGWNFLFFDLGLKSAWFYFSKYKKGFLLRKYKKSFLLRKYKNFF